MECERSGNIIIIIIMTLFNEEAQLDIHPIFPGVLKHTIIHTYNIYKHSIKRDTMNIAEHT